MKRRSYVKESEKGRKSEKERKERERKKGEREKERRQRKRKRKIGKESLEQRFKEILVFYNYY